MTQIGSFNQPQVRQTAAQQFQANKAAAAGHQQLLANRLAERLGLPAGSLDGPAEQFAPAKVAETVLGFIEGRLAGAAADGADRERLEKLYQQAQSGIEKGFAEARKILDGMGVLNGKVAEDIDNTWTRIQDGMTDLARRLLPDTQPATEVRRSESMQALAQTFDLSVTTRAGDQLRISIAEASFSQSRSLQASDGSSSVSARSDSSLRIGMWQVEVQGDLDAGERKALESLLGQVQELAGSFYAGDMEGAFDRALQLKMDGSQLASMSLQLTSSSVTQASSTYGKVAGGGAAAPSVVNNALREYASGLLQALQQATELTGQPRQLLEELLQGGLSLDARFDQPRLDKAMDLSRLLLDGLQALPQQPDSKA